MAYIKKAEAEKLLLRDIQEIGLEWWSKMNGEGKALNNLYCCIQLKNGTQRFWTNPSDEFLAALEGAGKTFEPPWYCEDCQAQYDAAVKQCEKCGSTNIAQLPF